jgi:hypothetical protein
MAHNGSVPSTPPAAAQTRAPGWGWDFRGENGPDSRRVNYTMSGADGSRGYFTGPRYPSSAEQYHGQSRGP